MPIKVHAEPMGESYLTPNFALISGAFSPGHPIPKKYTCEGANVSPPLTIEGVPEDCESLAVIVDDPDAPGKTFVHWVAFNVPPKTSVVAEDVDVESDIDGALIGVNDFGNAGFAGPCPPPGGPHHYHFRLYALDRELDLESGASKKQVTQAMDGHVLDETDLIGTYERSG